MSNLRVLDLRLTQEETHCDARRVHCQNYRSVGIVVERTERRRIDQRLLEFFLGIDLFGSEEKLHPLLGQVHQRICDLGEVLNEDPGYTDGT